MVDGFPAMPRAAAPCMPSASAAAVSSTSVAAVGGAAPHPIHATLSAASRAHSTASTSVADRGHGRDCAESPCAELPCAERPAAGRTNKTRSLLPAATPSMYPMTARMACTAGVSDVVPMARPTKIRLPVMTLVKAPPIIISVTTLTQPLAKVSRPM